MFDETNTSQEKKWHYRHTAEQALRHFRRRHSEGQYFDSCQEALTTVLGLIPEGAVVGCGDSVTLQQAGIVAALRDRQRNELLDPFERHEDGNLVMDDDERLRVMRRVLTSDIYLSGTNAITMDGRLVNIDGRGNRVAPMIFGPEKVIIVAGANKIVKNVEEAIR
ncbi:MAG: lactate utilization protein, partial [Chloroflexota bacterium]|nr:lactate utilization protein [Chloroflexota bacterium]